MYRFTITRFGETGTARPLDRKTEKGAVAMAWRWLEEHGCHGDEIAVYKFRGRKPCRTFIYKVRDSATTRVGSNGVKEKPAPFGKEPSVEQKRRELRRVMRRISIREKARAARDRTYRIHKDIQL
jgi:hypothetical protein